MPRPERAGAPGAPQVADSVLAAQGGDQEARERLIAQHTPLVLRVGARVCGHYLQAGRDDEVSVGLMAVNEAVDRYRPDCGASFPAFAELVVRRRLIDHLRRQSARKELPFSYFDQADDEGGQWSPVEFARAQEVDRERRDAVDRRSEVEEFQRLLAPYGITLRDLVRQSPQHQDARQRAVAVARAVAGHPQWGGYLRQHHALPLREMERVAELGVSRKTLERQRKFIIAVAVILMEGLHTLRSYVPDA